MDHVCKGGGGGYDPLSNGYTEELVSVGFWQRSGYRG